MKTKWKISPYLYLLPALVLLVMFRLLPILMSFGLSFFDLDIKGNGVFIGLAVFTVMVSALVFLVVPAQENKGAEESLARQMRGLSPMR